MNWGDSTIERLVLPSKTGHLEKIAFNTGKQNVHKVNHLPAVAHFDFLSRFDGYQIVM